MSLRPEHGGRLLFELEKGEPESGHYQVTLYTREAEFRTKASISKDGDTMVGAWEGGEPPTWLARHVSQLLRQFRRKHKEEAVWPDRVLRWRAC